MLRTSYFLFKIRSMSDLKKSNKLRVDIIYIYLSYICMLAVHFIRLDQSLQVGTVIQSRKVSSRIVVVKVKS